MRIALLGLICGSLHAGTPTVTAIVSAGSFNIGKVASNAFATIFGLNLSDQIYSATLPWPQSLGPTSVTLCDSQGENCTTPQLTYAGQSQINLLVPTFTIATITGTITETVYVTVAGVQSNVLTFQLKQLSPDTFFEGYDCLIDPEFQQRDPVCGLTFVQSALNQAYRASVTDLFGQLLYSAHPAKLGQYYTIWLTGVAPASDAHPFTMLLFVPAFQELSEPGAEITVTPTFIGESPQFPGLYQINFQVPTSIATGIPGYTYPFPCGDYNWELSVDLSQYLAAFGPLGPQENAAVFQIPVVVTNGDVPCK
jgi:uncharacterized protein (TIGR03437 family)